MTNDNFDIREWKMKQLLQEVAFNSKKSDLNKDGKLSSYEKKRGQAIAKNIKEQPLVPKPTGPQMHHNAEDLEESHWKDSNDESGMAHSQLYAVKDLADKLCGMIDDGEQLDAWVQAKLTKAEDYLNSVYRYLAGEDREHEREEEDEYNDNMSPMNQDVIFGAQFNERRGDTDYRRAKAAKRFGKKGEQNTFGAGVKKGEEIEKKKLRK
jgi:hypothetical protein